MTDFGGLEFGRSKTARSFILQPLFVKCASGCLLVRFALRSPSGAEAAEHTVKLVAAEK